MASAAGIRAGKAFVELGVNSRKLVAGIKAAGKRLKAFGASVTNIGAKVGAAGVAMVGAFTMATRSFMSAGDELDKMSMRVGASVTFLSKLQYAARLGGTEISAMEVGIRKLQRSAMDAQRGLSTQTEAFDMLGISVVDANGELKSTEQLFMETAAALSKVENNTKKAALASMLFGRAGTQLLPMLENGEEGLLAMMARAEELGLVMSEEDAAAAAKLTDAFFELWAGLKMGVFLIGASLAPVMQKVAEVIRDWIKSVRDWIDANREMIVLVFNLVLGVTALGVALMGIGIGIQVVGFALTGLGTALGIIGSMLGLLLSPVGLVVLAIAGLTAAFVHFTDTGDVVKQRAIGIFDSIANHSTIVFEGIQDALAAGDWKLAAQIGWQGLKQPFVSGWNFIREGFVGIRYFVTQTFADLWNGLINTATEALGWIVKKLAWVMKKVGKEAAAASLISSVDAWVDKKVGARRESAARAMEQRQQRAGQAIKEIQSDERANRAELKRLRQEAADKRAAREQALEVVPEPAAPDEPEIPTAPVEFGATSAAAVSRMGQVVERKIQEQQLNELEKIAKNTEPDADDEGGLWR